jgi:CRP/FNR family cyclic AMP-dependent transcriptional regulator
MPHLARGTGEGYVGAMREVLELSAGLPPRALSDGEALMEEGTPSTGALYVLVEGELEVVKEGGVQITTVSEPGSLLGEISLLLGVPHTATVRALGPATVLVAADGSELLASNPSLGLALARLLARRLALTLSYLADVRRQFADQAESLGMLDEVIESLVHLQGEQPDADPGSDREREPND